MNKEDLAVDIRDIETLMKVKELNQLFIAKAMECKLYFKNEIHEHFKNALKVIPFPGDDSSQYYFILSQKSPGMWEAVICHKEEHIPWESILPHKLIEEIAAHPVDADETVQLPGIHHKGNIFNVYFIKYLDDSIVGIVQRVPFRVEDRSESAPASLFDASQFLGLPEKDQVDVFLKYFKAYPGIRRKVLFDFFVKTLPASSEVKEII